MLSTKITFALPDWIRESLENRDKNPTFDDFVKFFNWKLEDYKLFDIDKIIIEAMFALYNQNKEKL